ncbi:MAG TPA: hypothetical protein VFZ59_26325, partial [Verrucomicrobiae bacterium]|nr:hypothetical protein [Verrucomicrobiae bacterium]
MPIFRELFADAVVEAFMKTVLRMASVLVLGAVAGTSWANGPDAAPLPAVETVIERALARAQKEAENDRTFKATYIFTRSKTNEYRNIRGNLTKRRVKTSVNEPSRRGGEDLDVVAIKDSTSTNRVSSDTSLHKRELLANTNLVQRFTFELLGREMVGGRPALLVEFKPSDKKFPNSSFKERCLSKVAGRVWLDEEEYAVVKAEARLTEGIGVVGGLVGAVHKFDFKFDRERTAEGIWYTRLLTWHLKMREVIVERTIDCVETKTDVRKAH